MGDAKSKRILIKFCYAPNKGEFANKGSYSTSEVFVDGEYLTQHIITVHSLSLYRRLITFVEKKGIDALKDLLVEFLETRLAVAEISKELEERIKN